MNATTIDQHLAEMRKNADSWSKKPLLRRAYERFNKEIVNSLQTTLSGRTLELGSGIGAFKASYPSCVTSDIFDTPWADRTESAYHLSFEDESCANIIMFDVFHHLAFPGAALGECCRTLKKGGRLIMFDQYISLLGFLVYGLFHHEPLGLLKKIEWFPEGGSGFDVHMRYYAATGNAMRVFRSSSPFMKEIRNDWKIVRRQKFSAVAYILSGGFSKPALYPESVLPLLLLFEKALDVIPSLFATRMIVVLEKK